mmetsp:Transcript_11006/g.45868  ORF Transcript_11006/g.45868 Transcript_11006/m.45868 type:complete len:239 (-) Transcript_11006:5187-5903(-)
MTMGAGSARRPSSAVEEEVEASVFFSGDARNALVGEEVSGGMRKTSTPRFRIARLTSPLLGSSARKSLNSGCAVMTLGSPSLMPHSLTRSDPPISSNGFSLSSTVGEQRFALSSRTHSPRTAALSSTPSTHSKRPAAGLTPPHASGPSSAARLRREDASDPSPASPPTSPASMSTSMSTSDFFANDWRTPSASIAARSARFAASASSAPTLSAAASHAARYALHMHHAVSTVTDGTLD